jgi:hypothetical protein
VADRLDIIAIRVAYKGAKVVGVVLGLEARLVQDFGSPGEGGVEQPSHSRAIWCHEGDMRLAETLAVLLAPIQNSGIGGTP